MNATQAAALRHNLTASFEAAIKAETGATIEVLITRTEVYLEGPTEADVIKAGEHLCENANGRWTVTPEEYAPGLWVGEVLIVSERSTRPTDEADHYLVCRCDWHGTADKAGWDDEHEEWTCPECGSGADYLKERRPFHDGHEHEVNLPRSMAV